MKSLIRAVLDRLATSLGARLEQYLAPQADQAMEAMLQLGRLHAHRIASLGPRRPLRETEFKVFSQWGEDGIIQYLIRQVGIRNDIFVEFGVENYRESNTRFLLINDNWRGLIMDASKEYMQAVRQESIYWRYDLTADAQFVTRENINGLIARHFEEEDIGLLSIDVDGNDY